MTPGFDSLNVATASGIVLHRTYLARRKDDRA
jgi:tRNA G18 (ribose-2'-O)-methylase SpoU